MNPLFEINVLLDQSWNVRGKYAEVTSIPFHGSVESPLFQGEILAGAADTQIKEQGQPRTLSARYVLEGTDFRGESCRIYVENTASEETDGVTKPRIVTDSKVLQWLEHTSLEGRLSSEDGTVVIKIYEKSGSYQIKEHPVIEGERSIYGTLFQPDPSQGKYPMIIMSHGYNGSEQDMHDMAKILAGKGIGCYCYDFCGGSLRSKSSGKSTQMSIATEQEDLRTVIRTIQKLDWVDPSRLYLYGESQGGFVAGLTAPELEAEIAGLFLIYPAFTIPDDWKEKRNTNLQEIPFWGLTLGRRFVEELPDYDVLEYAARYQKRVLLFHGDCDEVVKISYSQELLKRYADAELIIYSGQGHGFSPESRIATAGMIAEELNGK